MTARIVAVHDAGDFLLSSFRDRHGNPLQIRETEARIDRIVEGLHACTHIRWSRATRADATALIAAVHSPGYLAFLQDGTHGSEERLDARFAAPGVRPDTPLTAGAYDAAVRACASAVTAAQHLVEGERYAYALCRPPGHHAGRAFMGGYCYLNNAVVAATALRQTGLRVGVLDVDFHHGNGTADVLAREPDVPFVSLHASTEQQFPYMSTAPEVPQQRFVAFDEPPSERTYLQALERHFDHFAATDVLVVSLGYDLVEGDPHGGWCMTPDFFQRLAQQLASLRRPLCIVQEGGYALEQLAACSRFFAAGLT
jgi:acetoin utilization deacetylase AcuC-like enzyme